MNSAVNPRFVSRLTRQTLALILAGGRGHRLGPLTAWRAEPALPFGGKFRIIDFPLSNCINSGIRQIGVLTQYKSHSLIRHIQKGWGFLRGEFGEFVELLPAQQRVNETSWYQGTADAVYQNLDIIRSHRPEYVVVLAGDQIYKMDYGPMIAYHLEKGADMTIGCLPVPLDIARQCGVLKLNDNAQVLAFTEKPNDPEFLTDQPEHALASMGIYVFSTQFLFDILFEDAQRTDSSHDFGRDVIPHILPKASLYGYLFKNTGSSEQKVYWRDVGTVDNYWSANIELVGVNPELNMYDSQWPIWTYQEQLPPAKFVFNLPEKQGIAISSMVSGGCFISGAKIHRSLLFSNVWVKEKSVVEDSVILPDVQIGENCHIRRALIDRRCHIPAYTNIGIDPVADAARFHVSESGVVLVTAEMLGQKQHVA
ncbi:glucose-1-phosphate adenylyltransferase [Thioflexithrix psekupsensis]|uniref:Glucose-1-phosphate adenylyltransferase n=1 Tax=Thioflexithrix psekupsensis TaxID=1570016 RepID=A0A251X5S3_9GAMM|nr:glucose-1-phosphate adenylyltransferase [Thioflexithrix psekupsensis]OUD12926.1 glucose-1-phosphate adenylyltransferase [Thioflexithrix psekupsensis]